MNVDEANEAVSTKRRAGIQSVEIGMRVLEALADLGVPGPLSAVVRGCGLSPPQTHRYLASLAESGMVRQNPNGDYDLGPAALKLGMRALARIDIFKIADEAIGAFSTETGSTVLLAVLGPAGPTVVRLHVGNPPVISSLALGSLLSIVHSATGRVFLAYRPVRDTDALVKAELERDNRSGPADIAAIRQAVRLNGRASVGGTLIPGLNAHAFPILNLQGDAVLVATQVSTSNADPASVESTAERLSAVCARVSAIVGGHSEHGL